MSTQAVTGATATTKAKAAATKKAPVKKASAAKSTTTKAGTTKTAAKPRSKATAAKPGSRTKKFPPPGVVLHPDDANSKVFMAIGRSFLSVENRAMTIKDLAEMTVTFGLVCQNVSAASQAITTYIRTHMQRCEVQQDQPLLLRHVLSGTASDDDLLPALHSRSGGAHCSVNPENRVTNFRRGTMVWYMSRTTGAPCPFTRAGIRLCDYSEDDKTGSGSVSKEKKKQREREHMAEQCGQKRKRPLRGCAAKPADDEPPPKVKLTLRLKPLQCRSNSTSSSSIIDPTPSPVIIDTSKDSDSESGISDDDSMSVDSSSDENEASSPPRPAVEEPWSLPPYPRKSISIPSFTPSTDASYSHLPCPNANPVDPYRRSPSIPYSIGSPPPDSEDEDDDYHITMTGTRRHSTDPRSSLNDPDEWDADIDSEGDGDIGDSPGPRSPSAPVMLPEVSVKEEPTDVQGIVAAWDDFDDSLAGAKVAEVLANALVADSPHIKKEDSLDTWNWESSYTDPCQDWHLGTESDFVTRIKQEDVDLDPSSFFYPSSLHMHTDLGVGSSSPASPPTQLPGLLYSDSPSPERTQDIVDGPYATLRPRAKTQSHPATFSLYPDPPRPELSSISPASHSLITLIQSMSMNSPTVAPSSLLLMPPSCISPHETRGSSSSEAVVVHTCQPCTPAITATQIEGPYLILSVINRPGSLTHSCPAGISVYQMQLGAHLLLRRIDTDFVNLTPIVTLCGVAWPSLSTVPNATTVAKGSPRVAGTWVPLLAAQTFMHSLHGRKHLQTLAALRIFLADNLVERFPQALQDFHRASVQGRLLGQFGPQFGSTLQATHLCGGTVSGEALRWQDVDTGMTSCGAFALSVSPSGSPERANEEVDLPLSATEQEIFRALCDNPEWDKENSPPSSPVFTKCNLTASSSLMDVDPAPTITPGPSTNTTLTTVDRADRPLRRSKRVADAIAAQTQTRTRSRRGGSRNSLS
ncbi:hypothetical protein H0H81_010821 [Sphagnurus paluster]|uniref:GDS1 winged helix domain-containing protein n=1 Tax=Sphagnurus paluster TaxID=117069 RepID=A0A9P7FYR4_9AGAR|nr:hypothetical protein H0H81_010821 [Sphagnurus paluster]